MRPKATAARSTPVQNSGKPALSPAPSGAPATVEGLGQQLRDVLPARRLQSVSLCDHDANVLWLSEGALGPDEHVLMVDAIEQLSGDTALPCHETGLEDGRLAIFLPVRSPTGRLVGLAMILADGKSVGDDTLERMTAAPVRTIMQRLAVLLKPPGTADTSTVIPVLELELVSQAVATPAPEAGLALTAESEAGTPDQASETIITPAQIADILELELAPDEPPAGPTPEAEQSAPPPFSQPRAPASDFPSASDEDLVTEFEMIRLEFVPEPPVVNAAPPEPKPVRPQAKAPASAPPPAPAPAPTPAPAPVVSISPRPARVLPPPQPPPPRAVPRPAQTARRPFPGAAARAATPVAKAAPAAAPEPAPTAASTPAPPPTPVVTVAPLSMAAAAPPAEVVPLAVPSASDATLLLELLPFARLRAGGQNRRFQVQARSGGTQRDPAAQDALILQRLLSWLTAHRTAWNSQPTTFTVNLSITTLEDERFPQKIAAALNAHGIAAETLGFEIAEALCAQRRAQVERFIAQCEKLGSWVAIDDFSFDAQVMPLLRSRALRLLKLDARLTSAALRDKLSQAVVVATVQAAKVLGIHCAAKKVDSQAALQWLAAIGCDFAQGAALGHPQPLEALALATPPAAPAG